LADRCFILATLHPLEVASDDEMGIYLPWKIYTHKRGSLLMAITNNLGYVERGFYDPFDGQVLYPLNANFYP
jgi:hypothetical protein